MKPDPQSETGQSNFWFYFGVCVGVGALAGVLYLIFG